MKYDRLQEIENYLQSVKSATNQELMDHFQISMQTLRRDIKELEEKHILQKVYGGVVFNEEEMKQSSILDINLRKIIHVEEKQHIARLAASLVENDDIIFVDSGTTAFHMIPYLLPLHHVTIVTHSLHVMFALSEMTNITAICLGGVYRPETWSFQTDTAFDQYNYNKAFIATVGVSMHKGLTNTDFQEGVLKQHVIANANEVFILADATKFGMVAFQHFSDFDHVDAIITNEKPDATYESFFKKREIKVMY